MTKYLFHLFLLIARALSMLPNQKMNKYSVIENYAAILLRQILEFKYVQQVITSKTRKSLCNTLMTMNGYIII